MRTKYLLFIFISIFSLSIIQENEAKAQYVVGTQTIGSGTNQIDLSISVDSAFNIIKFVMTGPSTKWFGFVFNTTSMSNGSYTILANVNGGNPAEYAMVFHAAPTLQSTQNIQNVTSSTTSGRKTFTFYRNLSTGDANDFAFSYYTNNLPDAWAYGSGLTLSQHQAYGGSSINFINPCTTIIPNVLSSVSICQGDSTMIFGSYKKIAGIYTKVVKKQLACDSIVKQTLNVYNTTTTTLTPLSICNGDSIMIFGKYRKMAATYRDTLQSVHSCDSMLVQVLNVGSQILNTLPLTTICNGDSVMLLGAYRHIAGLYADTLLSSHGCDSIVIANLNITIIDTMVVFTSDSLKALQGATSYQWYNCATNQAVNNATSYYFIPSVSGNYKVKITKNNCDAFSSCHQVNVTTSINKISKNDAAFMIHPNPATDKITLNYDGIGTYSLIEIYDITGKIVVKQQIINRSKSENMDVSMLKTGIYFIKLSNNEQSITKKLIIN